MLAYACASLGAGAFYASNNAAHPLFLRPLTGSDVPVVLPLCIVRFSFCFNLAVGPYTALLADVTPPAGAAPRAVSPPSSSASGRWA
jgi:hypothetical protein